MTASDSHNLNLKALKIYTRQSLGEVGTIGTIGLSRAHSRCASGRYHYYLNK